MKKKSTCFILFIFLILQSCIEEYQPKLKNFAKDKYVISGEITDIEGFFTIYVSKSSSVYNPQKQPVSNCDIKVTDNKGTIFNFTESISGEYIAFIEQQYLNIGSSFKVDIVTPEGDLISSEYDSLLACPPIDSFYYEINEKATSDPDYNIPFVQFYIDYNGSNTDTKHIKIDIEGTYEYHSEYPLKWYWDRGVHELTEADYSKQICWRTVKEPDIYILSTENLNENIYTKFPIHTIPNTSEKLIYGYSLLIKQKSISEDAFLYYEKVKANIVKEESLYGTQPQQIEGNLYNVTNPDKKILGYFNVNGINTKRIFIESIPNFEIIYNPPCYPIPLEEGPGFLGSTYTILWYYDDNPLAYTLTTSCVDCTSLGGSIEKPNFWP
jgi:hypothetical protein